MSYTEEFNRAYEDLQKAIRDRSHLTQKVITDKNGHTRKVWVNPLDNEQMKKRKADKADYRDFTGFETEKKQIESVIKDVLGGKIIKMRTMDISKDGSEQFYMIDMDYQSIKSKIGNAKENLKSSLEKKGLKVIGDVSEKHFDSHWEYSTHYPEEHRFTFTLENNNSQKQHNQEEKIRRKAEQEEKLNKIDTSRKLIQFYLQGGDLAKIKSKKLLKEALDDSHIYTEYGLSEEENKKLEEKLSKFRDDCRKRYNERSIDKK